MQPASIRRLLVFGVCALGVTALYLVPGLDRLTTDADRADRQPVDAQPPIAYDAHAQLARASRSVGTSGQVGGSQIGGGQIGGGQIGGGLIDGRRTEGRAGSATDDEAPSIVSDLSFPTVTTDRLTVRWPAASDNVGVAAYRVWLNGYHVADTTNLQIAIRWFKDGSREQVVQVRAVDEAGNQSSAAPARVVRRPAAVSTTAGGAE